MATQLNVGIVGVVGRGKSFRTAFDAHPVTRIHAVCDVNKEKLPEAVELLGAVQAYTDYGEMLAKADVDAVVIGTPMSFHAPMAIQALDCGVHVMSEVTAAVSVAESRELVAAANRSDAVYMMAENMNFFHYIQVWKRKIQAGAIGHVFYAEAEYIHDCRGIMRDAAGELTWRASMPPIHYCTHSLGPLLDMLDDRCVSAVGMATGSHTEPEIGSTDMEVGLFKTARGRVIKILCGFTVTRKPALHWQVFYGTKGTLENRRAPGEPAKIFRADAATPVAIDAEVSDPHAPAAALAGGHGTSEYYMVDEFIQSVIAGQAPPIDIYRALDFSVPGLCAHLSVEQGGAPVEIFDYRNA